MTLLQTMTSFGAISAWTITQIIGLLISSQVLIELVKFFLYKKKNKIDEDVKLSEAYSKLLRDQGERVEQLEKRCETMNERIFAFVENANLFLKEKHRLEDRVKILEVEIKALEMDKQNSLNRNQDLEERLKTLLEQIENH